MTNPVYVASTRAIEFEPCAYQYFFSTNPAIGPGDCLERASCLIAGAREIIQAQHESVTSTDDTIMSVLEMASALINSVQIRTGGAA